MSMRIDILTLFPAMFRGPFDESIIKRAVESGVVSIHTHDIREWAKGRHKVADDYPYGGGPGMVLKPEPVFEATDRKAANREPARPQRRNLRMKIAKVSSGKRPKPRRARYQVQ